MNRSYASAVTAKLTRGTLRGERAPSADTSRMRIGVQLPEVEREVRWPEVVAMAQAADETGFDSIWLGDHLLYRAAGRAETGPREGWTQLAARAAAAPPVAPGA